MKLHKLRLDLIAEYTPLELRLGQTTMIFDIAFFIQQTLFYGRNILILPYRETKLLNL